MCGVVRCSNSSDDLCIGIGVIQPADQIIDRSTTGVDEQQQGSAESGVNAHPVLPVLYRSIEIWQIFGVQLKGFEPNAREVEKGDAEGRGLFQLLRSSGAIGSNNAAPYEADPVFCLQSLAEKRKQPRQIASELAGNKHQG